jgi:pyruvate dehydrogenase E2 component (dihydrolipoamide acetyltransferase)
MKLFLTSVLSLNTLLSFIGLYTQTMETGTIASWNMEEGDSFGPGDVICSVETDKATVDFEAQDDGVIAKILVEAGGDELEVGVPIMVTVEEEDDAAAFRDFVLDDAPPAAAPPAPAAETPPPTPPTPAPLAPVKAAAVPTPVASSGGKVVASPLAHMISKEMGYDISTIPGTGPDGRIIAADVREFVPAAAIEVATPAPAPAQEAIATATPIPGSGFTDYPISESAKEVADRLAQSKRNVPHYYLTVDICMDAAIKLKNELSAAVDEEEALGMYELIIKAAAKSMKAVPAVNASWMDSAVRVYDSVDMNVIVGTGDNLYTPVIRDCGTKGIKSISDELSSAMSAVESGEFTSEFASVGTFTIMNLGMYGIKSCAPIIREPQSCALALGAMENRIVPNDDPDSDEIYKESVMMTATISLDHRVVDGAAGAPWLSAFKSHLESPTTLLL